MISQSDIQGRLRLFRYGLIVVVVVAFLASLLAPVAYTNSLGDLRAAGLPVPGIGDFIGNAIIFTIVVAVIAVIVYAVYHYVLTKTWPMMGAK